MITPRRVSFPSLGFSPGFQSLATKDERGRGLGDITLPDIPFPGDFDLSQTFDLAGYNVPVWLVVAAGLVGVYMLGGSGAKRKSRSAPAPVRRRARRRAAPKPRTIHFGGVA